MPPTNLSLARQVDAACDRFESAWRAGQRPRIEDVLGPTAGADRAALLKALIAVEAELRRAAGESVTADTYRRRFPDDAEAITSALGSARDTSVSGESVRTGQFHPSTSRSTAAAMPAKIGRFPVTAVLGEGAFGRVFRATDPQLGRDVAIKVPLPAAVATQPDRERFLREARAAAGLHHPNICPVHEVGEENGHPYIVMGFVPGQSLAAVLKAKKEPLAPKQAALIARKLALALEAAHKKGVVHRDLKPANVMFDKERRDVVVTDFGLARAPRPGDAEATRDGVLMGTPAYMSPEQARGDTKAVGPASDQYALGVMLYEMLTGRRPFTGTVTEVLGQILHVEPESPTARRPDLSPGLAAVVLRAMAKDPAARYASMRQLADALTEFASDVPVARPASASVETAKAATDTQRIADMFAFTEQAVEKAIRKHKTPTWMKVGIGVLAVLAVVIPSVVFFTRSDKVKVDLTVVLRDVDLEDKSLSFFLDDNPVSAEALAQPVELKPGDHVFTVKRGKDIVKRVLLSVSGGKKAGIEVKDISPPAQKSPPPPPQADPEREVAEWVLRNARPDAGIKTALKVVPVGDPLPANVGDIGALPAVEAIDQLPKKPFKVVGISMAGAQATDEAMAGLAKLSSLRGVFLVDAPITDEGVNALAKHTGLFHLSLINAQRVTDRGAQHLARLTRLQILELMGPQLTDDGLAPLAGLTGLSVFGLESPNLTGAGLKHLHKLPSLTRLMIAGPGLTDAGLAELAGLTHLALLHLERAGRVTNDGLKVLAGMKSLEELWLTLPNVTDDGLTHLAKLDSLVRLHFQCPRVTDDGLKYLAGLWRLQVLNLFRANVTGTGLKNLAKLDQLRTLVLQDCPVTDENLAAAPGLDRLESLQLVKTRVTDKSIDRLKTLTRLKELRLEESPVTEAGLAALRKALPGCKITPEPKTDRDVAAWVLSVGGAVTIAPEGQEAREVKRATDLPAGPLRLIGVGLGAPAVVRDGDLARLVGLKALRNVYLVDAPVADAGLAYLGKVPTLQLLQLDGTRVTDAGLKQLAGLRDLKSLYLHRTAVTGSGLKDIPAAPLETLILGGAPSDEMAEVIGRFQTLRILSFASPVLTDAGLAHLGRLKNLWSLTISGPRVTDRGLDMLRGLTTLSVLGLGDTRVTDAGMAKLVEMKLPLTVVYVAETGITDDGLKQLARLPLLEEVNARGDKITDAGLARLAAAPKLHRLGLQNTGLTDAAVPHLKKLTGLTELALDGTQVTAAGRAELRKALPRCQITPEP